MSFGGAVKLTGESEYKKALASIRMSLQETGSALTLLNSKYSANDKSMATNKAKISELNTILDKQTTAYNKLKASLESMQSKYNSQAQAHSKLQAQYDAEKAKLTQLESTVGKSSQAYLDQKAKVADLATELSKSSTAMDTNATAISRMQTQLNKAGAEVNKTKNQITDLEGAENKAGNEADDLAGKTKKAGASIDDLGKKSNSSSGALNKLGSVCKGLGKVTLAGLGALGAGAVAIGKQALDGYANYEQLVGGVDTLFKGSSKEVQKYASQAYKTAGLSANQYMETVTSFSASLISSLGGDTAKASKVADKAIRDMSDNANKMGTDISMIQNAYQSFSRGQYQLLDNLKLGYGGTKSEMQRLLKDAEKISGQKFDLSNYADVVEAIHVIQSEMGITGTTAKEASQTIEGSVGAMKSAWANLVTGLADDNADFSKLMDNFVESIVTVGKNILPRVKTIISGIGQLFKGLATDLLPLILKEIPPLVKELLPILVDSFKAIVNSVATAIPDLVKAITDILPNLIKSISDFLPQLVTSGINIVLSLIDGIITAIPTLLNEIPVIINNIITALTNAIPLIIARIPMFLQAIINGLITALPILINSLPTMIEQILNGITQSIPILLNAIPQLMTNLINGIMTALPMLLNQIPVILQSLLSFLISNMPIILQGGLEIVKGLALGILNNLPQLVETAINLLDNVLNTILDNLPQLIEAGIGMIDTIINGIVEAIPKLIDMLPDIILNISTTLANNLPKLIESGNKIIMMLIDGAIKTLPKLLAMSPKIILTIVTAIINNLPKILSAGGKIITTLISGLVSSIGKLATPTLTIINNIKDGLLKGLTAIKDVGVNLVKGLWGGMESMKNWVVDKVKGFGKGILDNIKKVFGIHSPSKETAVIGVYLVQGLNQGMTTEAKKSKTLLNTFAKDYLAMLKGNPESYTEAGKSLIDSFNSGITNAIDKAKNKATTTVDNYFTKLIDGNETAQKELQKQIDKTSSKTKKKRLQAHLNELKEQNKDIKDLYNKFGKDVIKEFGTALDKATKGVTEDLSKTIQTLTDNMQKEIDSVNSAIDSMKNKLSDYGDLYTTYTDEQSGLELISLSDINKQTEALNKYYSNLTKLKGKVSDDLLAQITNMDVDEATRFSQTLLGLSSEELKAYDQAYSTKLAVADKISKDFYASKLNQIKVNYTDKITAEFNRAKTEITNIGKQTMQGFIDGMNSKNYTGAVKKMADGIIKQMKKSLGIHSPSKVFMELGDFSAQGYGLGFTNEMRSIAYDMQKSIPTDLGGSNTANINTLTPTQLDLVSAFKTALSQMSVELDDREVGAFVDKTVAKAIYT